MVNMSNDKISIIIPVYNVEKYLERSINSVLKQTYKNLEIILIDDGSTDSSGKICDEFAKNDERVKVVHKKNEGVSATRNLGISISTGTYIAFIDSDDWITEDYCETLYNNIKITNADISIIDYNVVNEAGEIVKDSPVDNQISANEMIIYNESDIIKEVLLHKTIKNFIWRLLYKKSVVGQFPVGVTYEDIVFTFQVLNKVKKAVYMKKNCYNYLQRTGSITATISEKNLKDYGNAIGDRYEVINKEYPELLVYNIYALLNATVALSVRYINSGKRYESINLVIQKFVATINEQSRKCEIKLTQILNDYQKLCLYLMRENLELYYIFLEERQKIMNLRKDK